MNLAERILQSAFRDMERIDSMSITIKAGTGYDSPWIVVDTVDIAAARDELLGIFGLTEDTEVQTGDGAGKVGELSLMQLTVVCSGLYQAAFAGVGSSRASRSNGTSISSGRASARASAAAPTDEEVISKKIEALTVEIGEAKDQAALKQIFGRHKDFIAANDEVKKAMQTRMAALK